MYLKNIGKVIKNGSQKQTNIFSEDFFFLFEGINEVKNLCLLQPGKFSFSESVFFPPSARLFFFLSLLSGTVFAVE